MNFISPLSRNGTGISEQSKTPPQGAAAQTLMSQSLGGISTSHSVCFFGPENHEGPLTGSASLAPVPWPPSGAPALARCAHREKEASGSCCLSQEGSPWKFPTACKDTFSSGRAGAHGTCVAPDGVSGACDTPGGRGHGDPTRGTRVPFWNVLQHLDRPPHLASQLRLFSA